MEELFAPMTHAEAVAHFRAGIIGGLAHAELARGQLSCALDELTQRTFRPPGSPITRSYGFSTLERWYYAYKKGGLEALKPKERSDRGHARALNQKTRRLLLDIRRDHPGVSVPLILATLVRQGQLDEDAISASTVRRLYRDHGLTRSTGLERDDQPQRLAWQAEAPFKLFHADVCHGAPIVVDGEKMPVRIHAMLDDASRFVVAIEAHHTEQEVDMLHLFADLLRRHPAPDRLYLDNGSTYSGELLKTVCARLDIGLIHAAPYHPQARGKMERFFRTLRQGCLNHVGQLCSLDELNKRLWAFVDQHYHTQPHSGLMGLCPKEVFFERRPDALDIVDEARLGQAFVARTTRRVRQDSTLSFEGAILEVDQRFLCGRTVDVCFCALDDEPTPWVEVEGKRFELHPVDPIENAHRNRTPAPEPRVREKVDFDPSRTLLDTAVGRTPQKTTSTDKETQ